MEWNCWSATPPTLIPIIDGGVKDNILSIIRSIPAVVPGEKPYFKFTIMFWLQDNFLLGQVCLKFMLVYCNL